MLKPLKVPSFARSVPKPLKVPSLARSVPKPLKMPCLARSVAKPLKVPSLARSVPKPLLIELREAGGHQPGTYDPLFTRTEEGYKIIFYNYLSNISPSHKVRKILFEQILS